MSRCLHAWTLNTTYMARSHTSTLLHISIPPCLHSTREHTRVHSYKYTHPHTHKLTRLSTSMPTRLNVSTPPYSYVHTWVYHTFTPAYLYASIPTRKFFLSLESILITRHL